MRATELGTREPDGERYMTVPRTLIFVTSLNQATGRLEVLLLKGAPDKRLWANRYNGLGGHVEADEDVLSAARREVFEESGLRLDRLALRGVLNVSAGLDAEGCPGVLVFVFYAESSVHAVTASSEGDLAWIPVDALSTYPLVDDLYVLIPLALDDGALIYGRYYPDPDGTMQFRFSRQQ